MPLSPSVSLLCTLNLFSHYYTFKTVLPVMKCSLVSVHKIVILLATDSLVPEAAQQSEKRAWAEINLQLSGFTRCTTFNNLNHTMKLIRFFEIEGRIKSIFSMKFLIYSWYYINGSYYCLFLVYIALVGGMREGVGGGAEMGDIPLTQSNHSIFSVKFFSHGSRLVEAMGY